MSGPPLQITAGVVAAAALAVVGVAPDSANAGGRPDLVVSSVQRPAAELVEGQSHRLAVRVRNRGAGGARGAAVDLLLSLDRRPDAGDLRLGGVSFGPQRAGASAARTARARVTSGTPRLTWHVLACADAASRVPEAQEGNNCRVAGRARVIGGSAFDLIDSARRRGRLTHEQALLHKARALVGDARLPAAFRGRGEPGPHGFLTELARELPRLSARARAELEPFLRPPAVAGSAWDADTRGRAASVKQGACPPVGPQWTPADGPHVRVWWDRGVPGDEARATRLVAALEGRIWPALVAPNGLAMRAPLADSGAPCHVGGDDRLDVYLVGGIEDEPSASGAAVPFGAASSCQIPRWLAIRRNAPRLETTLAHEVFHALQAAYEGNARCRPPDVWFDEATANWAEELVYPEQRSVHGEVRLLTALFGVLPAGGNGYESWTYPYWIHRRFGAERIRRLYEVWRNQRLFVALAQALPGGFDATWQDFVARAWNQPPIPVGTVDASFRQWNGLQGRPNRLIERFALGGARRRSATYSASVVGNPGRTYVDLDFSDRRAKQIEIEAPGFGGSRPGLTVTAFVQLGGGRWRTEDWTRRGTVKLCRDRPAEDVRRVVLAYGLGRSTAPASYRSLATRTVTLKDRCDAGRYPYYFEVVAASGRWQSTESEIAPPPPPEEEPSCSYRANVDVAFRWVPGTGTATFSHFRSDAAGRPIFNFSFLNAFVVPHVNATWEEYGCADAARCTVTGQHPQRHWHFDPDLDRATPERVFGELELEATDLDCVRLTRSPVLLVSREDLNVSFPTAIFEQRRVTLTYEKPWRRTGTTDEGVAFDFTGSFRAEIVLERVPPPGSRSG